jgi:hypothetical protein
MVLCLSDLTARAQQAFTICKMVATMISTWFSLVDRRRLLGLLDWRELTLDRRALTELLPEWRWPAVDELGASDDVELTESLDWLLRKSGSKGNFWNRFLEKK